MNIADVLNRAADHMEEVGFHKGDYFKKGPLYHHEDALVDKSKTEAFDRPCCTLGALYFAASDLDEFHAAKGVVEEVIRGRDVPHWNDMKSRRKEQVVRTLRAAAERASKVVV
jgi:hypothetical protein